MKLREIRDKADWLMVAICIFMVAICKTPSGGSRFPRSVGDTYGYSLQELEIMRTAAENGGQVIFGRVHGR